MGMAYKDLVEEVYNLDIEGKEQLRTLLEKIIIEERRDEIVKAGKLAEKNYSEDKVKKGTAADLIADLND